MDDEMRDALNFIEVTKAGFARHAFNHFMLAMRAGYANMAEKGTIAALPGSKTIEYVSAKWRVLDTYLVAPQSRFSGGSTTIWYGPVPVWMMQYVGHYDARAIPCLKAALRHNYEAGVFNGGRGPEFFTHETFVYLNEVDKNDFREFSCGKELIYFSDGELAGWHRYQSVYMVE